MGLLDKILGDANKKILKNLELQAEEINKLESNFDSLSDGELQKKTVEFKERLQKGESMDDLQNEAFAVVREVAKRTLGQRHYDVQMIGGLVLHQGKIAEMKTGEGKTLCSTTAIYLNALGGKGVHVITVNDYLSRRDCDWMGRVFHFLGLSISCIQNQRVSYIFNPNTEKEEADGVEVDMENLRPITRREAYQTDITYGTNNEFGFDYLRDNMVQDIKEKTQRGLNYAIIDEIDSILIDEARTPLIISAPGEQATEQYHQFSKLVGQLKENTDYNIDEKMKAATLTDDGISKVEKALGVDNIYESGGVQTVHHVEQALKARALFKRDRDYVVKEGEVIIVDEFTGRLMQGRRYSEGLHQAIEAKENLEIKQESRTLATITFQNLFRMYDKLSGMTGTAATEAEEFHKIYELDVVVIPTNRPLSRKDLPDSIYKSEMGKFKAVARKIKEYNKTGQPVLVGTISIEKNELLGEMLKREGIECELLNAKNHEKEAAIVAQAGQKGKVTVATNMAGRGVDIVLGEGVKELGGLAVIGTERHESRRIDNQLRGRAGRQGDPGETQFFVCMDDDLMRIFGSDRMKSMMTTLRMPEDMPIENKIISRSIESAQGKVEGYHFDTRKHLVEYDDVLNKHREVVYKKRNDVLELKPEQTRESIMELVQQEIEGVVSYHTNIDQQENWNLEEVYETLQSIFPVDQELRLTLEDIRKEAGDKMADVQAREHLITHLQELAKKKYDDMLEEVDDEELAVHVEKAFYLRAIDQLWMDHLDQIGYLREGIGLRGYAQRDPLVEYKREGFEMFTQLMASIQRQVVYNIYKMSKVRKVAPTAMQKQNQKLQGAKKNMGQATTGTIVNKDRVGRNEPCPCGSGKKYKKCHGK